MDDLAEDNALAFSINMPVEEDAEESSNSFDERQEEHAEHDEAEVAHPPHADDGQEDNDEAEADYELAMDGEEDSEVEEASSEAGGQQDEEQEEEADYDAEEEDYGFQVIERNHEQDIELEEEMALEWAEKSATGDSGQNFPRSRKHLEEAASKQIGVKTQRLQASKAKLSKAKASYKTHKDAAAKAKAAMTAVNDKLKENGDLLKADVDESEGHFKLARRLDEEASSLKKAAMHTAMKTSLATAKLHVSSGKETAAKEAKSRLMEGALTMRNALSKEVDETIAHLLPDLIAASTEKAVEGSQKAFEQNLTLEVRKVANNLSSRTAAGIVKKELNNTNGLTTAKDIGKLLQKQVNSSSKKFAASEVDSRANQEAEDAVGKYAGREAESAVKKHAKASKKKLSALYKSQMGTWTKEEKAAKKHGIALVPPETADEESAKLLEILKKQGVHAALEDAKKDRAAAAKEKKEAMSLQHEVATCVYQARRDTAVVRSSIQKQFAGKYMEHVKNAGKRAQRLLEMTKKNVIKKHEVTMRLDQEVKAYEAAKTSKKVHLAAEVKENKKALSVARSSAKKAGKKAKTKKDKALVKTALKLTRMGVVAHKKLIAAVQQSVAKEAMKAKKPATKTGNDDDANDDYHDNDDHHYHDYHDDHHYHDYHDNDDDDENRKQGKKEKKTTIKKETKIQAMLSQSKKDIVGCKKDHLLLVKLKKDSDAQGKIDLANKKETGKKDLASQAEKEKKAVKKKETQELNVKARKEELKARAAEATANYTAKKARAAALQHKAQQTLKEAHRASAEAKAAKAGALKTGMSMDAAGERLKQLAASVAYESK